MPRGMASRPPAMRRGAPDETGAFQRPALPLGEEIRGWTQDMNIDAGPPFPRPQGTHMAQSFTGKKRTRKSFGRIPEAVQMPNLIEVQRSSYEQFLQRETRPGKRIDEGIEAVFKSVFPIKDFNERAVLEYV